jgi:transcriptional regulator with PAS, ATPase and Fis domain
MTIQQIKQRFSIIGNAHALDRAIDVAMQVASTDLSVLIAGESGTGKEFFPQIIHQNSVRKHGSYIAVNCGAIPEGTIDSELFGHEKGAFTGAHAERKGYFEVADGGTIFLDEVGELPLSTQVRLLRVLESGEFIRVGSSKVQKIDVRVVAATNIEMSKAIEKGKFREDLFYRLNTVPIKMPALRERGEDIALLFRKFAADFAEKYRMPPVRLDDNAREMLINYRFPGNIRQLKNIAEQISVIEKNREISLEQLLKYIPQTSGSNLPAIYDHVSDDEKSFKSEREILYQVLFDMKKDMTDLKSLVNSIMKDGSVHPEVVEQASAILSQDDTLTPSIISQQSHSTSPRFVEDNEHIEDTEEYIEESLSLVMKEVELIRKALEKHKGRRRNAAADLGISERTLYRKIKEHNIE